jgi:hypothetical protein
MGSDIQIAIFQNFVEGKIVETFDQFGVGDG